MKIVVLAGGISTERDVSLSSGTMIYRALKKSGHQAILIDVYFGLEQSDVDPDELFTKDEKWDANFQGVGEIDPDIEEIKARRTTGDDGFFGPNVIRICQASDLVFLALHGENGENGKVQAAFDLLGIRYTGTDYLSSALAMDKKLTKEIFEIYGVPTPDAVYPAKGERPDVTFPVVVKTSLGGSSVGVYIVQNEEEYETALNDVYRYEGEAIIEQYIKGREFSVGVVGGEALPVIEIAPISGFYDYKNKYQAGSTVETCPADLDKEKTAFMKQYAEKAFHALRLQSYARMDFMMSESGELFCLEANTLPGMTPTSLLPQEALAMGRSFEELCEWIIHVSMEKYEK
ncbi:MAG: D-alanine--D-alanine ligase [Lachnospiraceae bacterium]|nr:D-alanine--D-alanine ligase [Lachnospiraceae bacterium]MDD3659912.1 D-alanine--D-alanine ligase [Lachnospiraceae bacterium]